MTLRLVATCALGLEEILHGELAALGVEGLARQRGAVTFRGDWPVCWRANWRLRTANRVLVELGSWPGTDGDALAAGARALIKGNGQWGGLTVDRLFHPRHSFAIRASTSHSAQRDVRWIGLKVKDGLVDGQRERFGQRASIDRRDPDLPLRVWLHSNRAALFLDTSGAPLDRRGYREASVDAPLREQLAAACVLAAGWDGRGPVVDPMCGSGTLLAEAAFYALGRAPGDRREGWAFERLPGFRAAAFAAIRREPIPAPGPQVRLYGSDRDPRALTAARRNLARAGLAEHSELTRRDAFSLQPPPGPGLVLINPAYGERLQQEDTQWRRLGDLLKQRFTGWRAVIIAGDANRGKHIGLRPERRIPVRNGPLDARILVFALY